MSDEPIVQANEREVTAAEAWELRYLQVQEENHALRSRITQLQEEVLVNQKEILRRDREQHGTERSELMDRLGVDSNATLVDREGSYFIVFENGKEKV